MALQQRLRQVLSLVVFMCAIGITSVAYGKHFHVVDEGDTLWEISRSYGCTLDALREANAILDSHLDVGQRLQIPRDTQAKPTPRFVRGQSIGATNRGRLRNATRLKAGRGYFIRRPERSYGAHHTIAHIHTALQSVRTQYPKAHRLAVGDISVRKGGKISMHASHQSGRDIDLGFFYKKRPKGYPQSFVDVTAKNLDFDATWALIEALAKTAGTPAGVETVFIGYATQKLLYKQARKHGISKVKLILILQYPHGRSSRKAFVRHEPGHNEHMHVRFSCPPRDERCH